jgi:hypothetical protein
MATSLKVCQSLSPFYLKINYDIDIKDTFSAQAVMCRDSTNFII